MFLFLRLIFVLVCAVSLMACSSTAKTAVPRADDLPINVGTLVSEPLAPDQGKAVINQVGNNWFYGQGVGEALLNTGLVVTFPPYGLVVLGNAALSAFGYQQVGLSSFMPEELREDYLTVYNGFTSGPGRLTAAVAGKDYIDKAAARENLQQLLEPQDNEYFPYGNNPF